MPASLCWQALLIEKTPKRRRKSFIADTTSRYKEYIEHNESAIKNVTQATLEDDKNVFLSKT